MTPEAPHVPPLPAGAAHMISGRPPATRTRFSLPVLKNAIDLESGDQKGYEAASVPGISRASDASSERTHSVCLPGAAATKATVRPSGEITAPLSVNIVPAGGFTDSRTAC